MTAVAAEIRRIRTLLGLTQAELAARLEPPTTHQQVQRWEAGLVEPRASVLLQLQAMEREAA